MLRIIKERCTLYSSSLSPLAIVLPLNAMKVLQSIINVFYSISYKLYVIYLSLILYPSDSLGYFLVNCAWKASKWFTLSERYFQVYYGLEFIGRQKLSNAHVCNSSTLRVRLVVLMD